MRIWDRPVRTATGEKDIRERSWCLVSDSLHIFAGLI